MENDLLESRIVMMAMRAPAARANVDFDISALRRTVAELQNRPAKVGSAFYTSEAGMKNSDTFAVQSFEFVAQQPLVLPDGLEKMLGRRLIIFAQEANGATADPPVGVEAVKDRSHLALLLRTLCCNVKP